MTTTATRAVLFVLEIPLMSAKTRAACAAMLFCLGVTVARADAPAAVDVSRWVSDDAVIYVEATRPADLVDRLMDPRVRKPLLGVPSIKKAVEGEPFRHVQEVAKLLSDKLGTSWDKTIQGITGGGIVFAVEVV